MKNKKMSYEEAQQIINQLREHDKAWDDFFNGEINRKRIEAYEIALECIEIVRTKGSDQE